MMDPDLPLLSDLADALDQERMIHISGQTRSAAAVRGGLRLMAASLRKVKANPGYLRQVSTEIRQLMESVARPESNYLNSPLPGCAPVVPPVGPTVTDLADLLELERFRLASDVITANEEARYMLQTLEQRLRSARTEPEQLDLVGRMLRELSQLWARHHGPGWVLTSKAEEALSVAKVVGILDGTVREHVDQAEAAGYCSGCGLINCTDSGCSHPLNAAADGPTPLSDAGEGC